MSGIDIFYEVPQAFIEKKEEEFGFEVDKRANKQWLIDVLYYLRPDHSIFSYQAKGTGIKPKISFPMEYIF